VVILDGGPMEGSLANLNHRSMMADRCRGHNTHQGAPMRSIAPSSTTRLRPVVTAILFFAATVLGQVAVATAEPVDRDWFNNCVQQGEKDDPNADKGDIAGSCCIRAGGVAVLDADGNYAYCANPPSAPAGSTQQQINPNLPLPTRETLPPGPVPLPVQAVG
jgi:hypothetical protein